MIELKCIIAFMAYIVGAFLLTPTMGCHQGGGATSVVEPTFTKQGELTFVRGGATQEMARIDVEIADTPQARTQGLMYRHSLPADAGMLFIFDVPQMQLMWMKNTYISLDIIFVNEAKQIVRIAKNTVPLSQALISSGEDVKYAVEVNAGYCETHGIAAGDVIDYVRTAK